MYTWGCKTLDDNYNNNKKEATCTDIFRRFHGNGSSRKQRQRSRMDSISFNQKASLPSQKVMLYQFQFAITLIYFLFWSWYFSVSFLPWAGCELFWLDDFILQNAIQESRDTQEIKSFLAGASSSAERSLSHPKNEAVSCFSSVACNLSMVSLDT